MSWRGDGYCDGDVVCAGDGNGDGDGVCGGDGNCDVADVDSTEGVETFCRNDEKGCER